MKNYFFLVFFCLFVTLIGFSTQNTLKKDISFKMIVDFSSNPYIFEPSYSNESNAFNGRIMLGLRYNILTFGISMFENYFSTGQHQNKTDFFGASNIFKWTFDFFVSPFTWMEVKTSMGGSFFVSSYSSAIKKYNDRKINAGLFLLLDMKFILPIKLLELQLLNRLDIILIEIQLLQNILGE